MSQRQYVYLNSFVDTTYLDVFFHFHFLLYLIFQEHGGENSKQCLTPGCTKFAAAGPVQACVRHGGGPRCTYPGGCNKGACAGALAMCVKHGGGKRCSVEGCNNSAPNIGGSAASSSSSLPPKCVTHGGGKRCTAEGGTCGRAAVGPGGLCVTHGGGRHCEEPGCGKHAQAPTKRCKAHGDWFKRYKDYSCDVISRSFLCSFSLFSLELLLCPSLPPLILSMLLSSHVLDSLNHKPE